MTKALILLFLTVVLSSSDCHKKDPLCGNDSNNVITIRNNSGKRINYAFYWNYPDSAITENNSPLHYSYQPTNIGSFTTRGIGMGGCWESVFAEKPKEWIYFFDEDSLEQLPWKTITANGREVLERRELTLDNLKQNNFTITYP